MKHLHHFNFNSQELEQCPHCHQYLPKSNNGSQSFQMQVENSPYIIWHVMMKQLQILGRQSLQNTLTKRRSRNLVRQGEVT
jgi:hypothetical protein